MILHLRLYYIFVILIFVVTVHGVKITRCLGGPHSGSYTCPGLSDPPEKTHCCLRDGQPACCLPGPKDGINDRLCSEGNGKVSCSHVPHWITTTGVVLSFIGVVVVGCICAILYRLCLCPKL